MMENTQYPESIYIQTIGNGVVVEASPHGINGAFAQHGYRIGLKEGMNQASNNPLEGYSNLTKAVQDGVKVEWGRLDGLQAKCVNKHHGIVSTRLTLQEDSSGLLIHPDLSESDAWREEGEPLAYLLDESWLGNFGWSLWIEGSVPVEKVTADTLEPATCFLGKAPNRRGGQLFIRYDNRNHIPENRARVVPLDSGASLEASSVEVIEVYGIGTLDSMRDGN